MKVASRGATNTRVVGSQSSAYKASSLGAFRKLPIRTLVSPVLFRAHLKVEARNKAAKIECYKRMRAAALDTDATNRIRMIFLSREFLLYFDHAGISASRYSEPHY